MCVHNACVRVLLGVGIPGCSFPNPQVGIIYKCLYIFNVYFKRQFHSVGHSLLLNGSLLISM